IPAAGCRSPIRRPADPASSATWRSAGGYRFRRCSSAWSAALVGLPARWCRSRRLVDAHVGAVGQPVLAVGHDLLADRDALGDHRDTVLRRRDLERPTLDGIVGLDDVAVGAVGALHDRALRHRGRALAGRELQTDADELAGPQLLVLVLVGRLQPQRAGRRVDLVVDQRHLALGKLVGVVGAVGVGGQRLLRLGLAQIVVSILRYGEIHEDRLDLGDRHQRGPLARLHQVAEVDQPLAGAAVDRRADLGIDEVELGGVDRRLVAGERRLEAVDRRLLLVVALARLVAGPDQLAVAVEIELGAFELRLVTLLGRGRAIEPRLVRPRVDLEQQVAFLDVLALAKIDFDDLAVDSRFDRHGLVGLHRAEAADINRHVARLGDRHRDRNAAGTRWCHRCPRFVAKGLVEEEISDGSDHQHHADDHDSGFPDLGHPPASLPFPQVIRDVAPFYVRARARYAGTSSLTGSKTCEGTMGYYHGLLCRARAVRPP